MFWEPCSNIRPSKVYSGNLFAYEYPKNRSTRFYPITSTKQGFAQYVCDPHTDTFIDCDPDGPLKSELETFVWRMGNSSRNEGAVNVNSSTLENLFGHICEVSMNIISNNVAKVLCRSAGKPYATAHRNAVGYFVNTSEINRFIMTDLECDGTEEHPWRCKHRTTCHFTDSNDNSSIVQLPQRKSSCRHV